MKQPKKSIREIDVHLAGGRQLTFEAREYTGWLDYTVSSDGWFSVVAKREVPNTIESRILLSVAPSGLVAFHIHYAGEL